MSERTAPQITDSLPTWAPWALLVLGMGVASFAAPLIRYTDGDAALAVSFWRCSIGALVLLPFAMRSLRARPRREMVPAGVAGFFLALHFATWIASVNRTSVAASVLLVSLAPIFVASIAPLFLRERLTRTGWLGIVIALVGTVFLAGMDYGNTTMGGNVLALIGGATAGYYMLAGQIARRRLNILEYAVVAYSLAAVLLLIACLVAGVDLWGYRPAMWWAIAGLVVGPQLLGHTVLNLVLSDIDATTVSVAIMAEPVIAIIAAYFLFDESPTWLLYPAGVMILFGVYLVSTARRVQEIPPE